MPNILAIDTSSPVLSIALQKSDETILESSLEHFMTHAENLLPTIEKMLKENKLTIEDIHIFLLGRGPGSFTGLRIGFATIKGFLAAGLPAGQAGKAKCFGAISLDIIAMGVPQKNPDFLAVGLDAYRGKIYARFYGRKHEGWHPKGKPQILNPDEFWDQLPEECVVTGDALTKYGDLLKTRGGKKINYLPQASWYPRAIHLISCYHTAKFSPLQPLVQPADFVPLYFRLSEAEEKRKQHARSC